MSKDKQFKELNVYKFESSKETSILTQTAVVVE